MNNSDIESVSKDIVKRLSWENQWEC